MLKHRILEVIIDRFKLKNKKTDEIKKNIIKIDSRIRNSNFADRLVAALYKLKIEDQEFINWIAKKGLHRIKEIYKKSLYVEDQGNMFNEELFQSFLSELYDRFKLEKEHDEFHIYKTRNTMDNISLTKYKNRFYRNLPKKRIEIWQKLVKKGLNVEPIIAVYDRPPLRLMSRFLIRNKQHKYVVSEETGRTLGTLLNYNELDFNLSVTIFKQMINTIGKMWDFGYIHGHPHINNWTFRMEKGQPKVYLIDFSFAQRLKDYNKESIKRILTMDYKYISNILNYWYKIYIEKTPLSKQKDKYKAKKALEKALKTRYENALEKYTDSPKRHEITKEY